jgi:hypothetical protein
VCGCSEYLGRFDDNEVSDIYADEGEGEEGMGVGEVQGEGAGASAPPLPVWQREGGQVLQAKNRQGGRKISPYLGLVG